MIKEFYKIEQIEKYYDKNTNTYVFMENDIDFDVYLYFNLCVDANIDAGHIMQALNIEARDINARDINASIIKARNIKAQDIRAWSIEAENITYYAVCFAYNYIKCKSIKGMRYKSKRFVLDGKIEIIK